MASSEFLPKHLRVEGGSPDLTKKRILAAAELVFSRDGFQGATTREIAREAGVNEVTLFRHFHSREQLLRATLEYGCEAFDALVEPEKMWRDELPDGLEGYIRDSYSVVKQREAIVRAFIGEARLLPESVRRLLQEFMLTRKARFVAALQRAQDGGFVRKEVDVSAVESPTFSTAGLKPAMKGIPEHAPNPRETSSGERPQPSCRFAEQEA